MLGVGNMAPYSAYPLEAGSGAEREGPKFHVGAASQGFIRAVAWGPC